MSIVHRASPGAVDTVLARLCEHGIEAVQVDEPSTYTWGTHRVGIAVPTEQVEEARRVLAEWDREVAPRLARLRLRWRRSLLAATPLALVTAGVIHLAGGTEGELSTLLVAFVACWSFWVLALVTFDPFPGRRD